MAFFTLAWDDLSAGGVLLNLDALIPCNRVVFGKFIVCPSEPPFKLSVRGWGRASPRAEPHSTPRGLWLRWATREVAFYHPALWVITRLLSRPLKSPLQPLQHVCHVPYFLSCITVVRTRTGTCLLWAPLLLIFLITPFKNWFLLY